MEIYSKEPEAEIPVADKKVIKAYRNFNCIFYYGYRC